MPSRATWRHGRPEILPSRMWAVRKSPHNDWLAWRLDNSDEIHELPFQVGIDGELPPRDASFTFTPNKICNACRAILLFCKARAVNLPAVSLAARISVNYGLQQLQQSALLGCHLCAIFETCTLCTIRDGKPSPHRLSRDDNDSAYIFFDLSASGDENALFNIKVWHGNDAQETGMWTLRVYPAELLTADVSRGEAILPSLGQYTGDSATFSVARHWLHECKNQHKSCHVDPNRELASTVKFRPEVGSKVTRASTIRLLFVEGLPKSPLVKLIDYLDDQDPIEYVALSHCWGDQAHVPRLLTTTEARMRAGIDLTDFPKTFMDAFEIALRLGYCYLWIDSLCIIQNSVSDWQVQSTIMSQIYKRSVLTLAALKSTGSRGGCFTTARNPLSLRPLVNDDLALRVEPLDKSQIWQLEVDESGPMASPLHSRAWVVQERLSASRTLYYGSLGIYWECREKTRSESYDIEYPWAQRDNKKTLRDQLTTKLDWTRFKNLQDRQQRWRSFQEQWRKFLDLYTPCLLTYPTDKLMAIKGIINDIYVNSGNTNLFGLWTDNLASELLWWVAESNLAQHDTPEPCGRSDNRFPSWTWASVHGRILYHIPAGVVDWQAQIEFDDAHKQEIGVVNCNAPADHDKPDLNVLRLTTWRRSIEINENDALALIREPSHKRWGGDYEEEYSWTPDGPLDSPNSLHIILIQRAIISEEPRLRVARCLVVRSVNGKDYGRVGLVQVRYGSEEDNPFNTNGQAEAEVIRLS